VSAKPAAAQLAWSLCAVSLVLLALSIPLLLLSSGTSLPRSPVDWGAASWAEQLATVVGSLGAPILGAVIAAHRPGNRYGWLWCLLGFAAALSAVTGAYATYSLSVASGGLPGTIAAAWLTSSVGWVAQGLWPLVVLLFPDGRLPSRRWRPVAWLAGSVCVGLPILFAITPGRLDAFPFLTNPIGFSAAIEPILGGLGFLLWTSWLLLNLIVAPIAVITRFLRARGQERQQLKWLALVGLLTLSELVTTGFVKEEDHPLATAVVLALGSWATYAAIGIAIVAHRLYDIDRVLNRTAVYGLLTAVLGLGYAGVILGLGELFGGVTRDPPSWAVAGATLGMAALFQPARRRVQGLVDRRFNRRRYDAARSIQSFSARLRQQIDLEALKSELLAVVEQTMEPTAVSLWLRASGRPLQHQDDATPASNGSDTSRFMTARGAQ